MKKTRSLLVTLSGYPYTPSSFLPDNGLANLAACLKEAGHETLILDYNTPQCIRRIVSDEWVETSRQIMKDLSASSSDTTYTSHIQNKLDYRDRLLEKGYVRIGQEISEIAKREKADWVGIKVWNGDGYTASCIIARVLKECDPELSIIAGGPQVDWFGSFFLEVSPYFDFAAYAEGEPMIVPFAEMILGQRKISEVPNLYYRDGNKIIKTALVRVKNLDDIPTARYEEEIYPSLYKNQKINMGILEESRGCPIQCYFCEHPIKAGNVLRKKTISHLIDELKTFSQTPGFHAYKFAGSFTPTKYLQDVARNLLELPFSIKYVTYGHLKETGTDFNLLQRSGCMALFFGIETGSELLLDEKIRKGYEKKKAIQTLKNCKDANIFTITSVIYPFPDETEESTEATLNVLKEIQPDSIPLHFPLVLPQTPWCNQPEKFGFTFKSPYNDPKEYLSFLINYKARLLFPPQYWTPLPYRVGEKPFEVYSKETAAMTHTLEKMGLLTLVSDEVALIGKHSGLSVRQFRDECRSAFLKGEDQALEDLITKVNLNFRAI